jgi:hypothetical protein
MDSVSRQPSAGRGGVTFVQNVLGGGCRSFASAR